MRESTIVPAPAGHVRRSYATPVLSVYGNLVDLTATGSMATGSEAGSPNGNMQCVSQYKRHQGCFTP